MEILFLIVGGIFFMIGALIIWDFLNFKHSAYSAQGQIVAFAVRQSSSKTRQSETYAPVVQYEAGGRTQQFTASIASSQVRHAIGDALPIFIHNTDPTRARLDTPMHSVLGGVFMVLGLVAMTVFFFVFRFDVISLLIAAAVIGTLVFKVVRSMRRHQIRSLDDIKAKISEAKQTGGVTIKPKNERLISDPAAFKRRVTRKQTAPVWLMLIFLLVGLGMVAGGVYLGAERLQFIQNASVGWGTVVDFNRKTSTSDGSTTTTYYPVVEYTPRGRQERTVRFEHDIGSSHPGYHRGDEVKVLYSAEYPDHAIIDEGWMNYFGPLILLAMGTIFVLISLSIIIKQRKRRTEQAKLKLDF